MVVDNKGIYKTLSPVFFFVVETGKMELKIIFKSLLDTVNWKFYSFQMQRLYSCPESIPCQSKHVKSNATDQIDAI